MQFHLEWKAETLISLADKYQKQIRDSFQECGKYSYAKERQCLDDLLSDISELEYHQKARKQLDMIFTDFILSALNSKSINEEAKWLNL